MGKEWQKENGKYTRIANDILEKLACTSLTGRDRRVIDVIIRKTYGFHKKEAQISAGYIALKTGIAQPHVCEILKKLRNLNIIYSNVLPKTVTEPTTEDGISEYTKDGSNKIAKNWLQVHGINKNTAKWSVKTQLLPSTVYIKEIVNFFKESAARGGFDAAIAAWLKEKRIEVEQDEFIKTLVNCIKGIAKKYPDGLIPKLAKSKTEADMMAVEDRLNDLYRKAKDKTKLPEDHPFRLALREYYKLWIAAIEQ